MKIMSLLFFLVTSLTDLSGQNLIGYDYYEIREFMKENRKDLSFNKVNNTKFNYLKYSDSSDSQTTVFFLDEDSVCRSIRLICDQSAKAQKIKELNSTYKRKGENRWIDRHEGKNYVIELTDEQWTSVFTWKQQSY